MKLSTLAFLICLAGCIVACANAAVPSIDYEIRNQRHIAHSGYGEYQQFTEANQ